MVATGLIIFLLRYAAKYSILDRRGRTKVCDAFHLTQVDTLAPWTDYFIDIFLIVFSYRPTTFSCSLRRVTIWIRAAHSSLIQFFKCRRHDFTETKDTVYGLVSICIHQALPHNPPPNPIGIDISTSIPSKWFAVDNSKSIFVHILYLISPLGHEL